MSLEQRLVLVRHGRTAWNAEGRFQGQADPPLDDLGWEQAHRTAMVVAAMRPEAIVSSDLRRAHQTAVMLGAACLFVFGWGLALVAPKVARWFAMFVAMGAGAAAAVAAKGAESPYTVPLLCVGVAAILVVFASYRGDRQERRARTT